MTTLCVEELKNSLMINYLAIANLFFFSQKYDNFYNYIAFIYTIIGYIYIYTESDRITCKSGHDVTPCGWIRKKYRIKSFYSRLSYRESGVWKFFQVYLIITDFGLGRTK